MVSPSAKVRFAQIGAYVQDEWTVNDRVKLTAGLRLDNLSFNNKDVMTNNATYKLDFGGKHVDTGKWPKTSIQVSPRLGFSWDVFGDKSLKVRGGTGLFQGRLPLVFFTNMPQNAGMIQTTAKYTSSFAKDADGKITGVKYPDDVKAALITLNGGKETGGHLITNNEEYIKALGLNTNVTPQDGATRMPISTPSIPTSTCRRSGRAPSPSTCSSRPPSRSP